MVISKADIDNYRDTLMAIGADAASSVTDALKYTGSLKMWQVRDAAAEAISDSIGTYGDMAQALAAQLFDEICAAEGINATADIYDGVIDEDMMASEVYFFARKLVEGNHDGFVLDCGNLADFYVMRSAYENTMRNCHQYNMRYARIPTGPDTCPWCLMLASRGFVYYTEHDAMAGCHKNCDCVAVPGRGGYSFNDATQVEGYDPDEYYALWRASGFMSPKTNPTPYRMVYNQDGATQRRSSRAMRKAQEARRSLTPQQTEAIYRRLNAAKTRDGLSETYKDVIGEFIRSDNTLLDGDWEDVANHYRYLLEEFERKKKRK